MRKTLVNLILISLIFILSACNLAKNTQPTSNVIATQVAVVLTSMPTATSQPLLPKPTAQLSTATQPIAPSGTATFTTSPTISPTSTITATATELQSVTPTATISSADPKSALGKATWERNTFSDGTDFGTFDTSNPETSVTIKNNLLVLTAKKADKFIGWRLSYPRPKDYYLEATVTTSDCSGADQYGLVLRASDYDHAIGYFLGFTCDGRYELNKWDGSKLDNIIAWKSAAGINSGSNQTNRLGIMLKGDKLTIYVNDNLLSEVNDSTYPDAGYFGLFIASANTVGFNIQLSKIAYWDLP